jgi:hypothetical protein
MSRNGAFFLAGAMLAVLVMVGLILTPSPTQVVGAPLEGAQPGGPPGNGPAAQSPPAPAPSGPVPTTPEFAQALLHWHVPVLKDVANSQAGKRETWLHPCASGKVNVAVTRGWCYVPELKLFYNIQSQRLLDPLTSRVFGLGPTPGTLVEFVAEEGDELGQPPTLTLPKGSTAGPVSLHCTPDQQVMVQQTVAGLQANASRTDSQAMASFFSFEASWWGSYCA